MNAEQQAAGDCPCERAGEKEHRVDCLYHPSTRSGEERNCREALRGLLKLVADNDLVRNTANDGDLLAFVNQGSRIVNALKAATDALAPKTTNQANDDHQTTNQKWKA